MRPDGGLEADADSKMRPDGGLLISVSFDDIVPDGNSYSLDTVEVPMVRSTLLHLHLSAGLRLILGLPALVHDFDPLTLNL